MFSICNWPHIRGGLHYVRESPGQVYCNMSFHIQRVRERETDFLGIHHHSYHSAVWDFPHTVRKFSSRYYHHKFWWAKVFNLERKRDYVSSSHYWLSVTALALIRHSFRNFDLKKLPVAKLSLRTTKAENEAFFK